MHGGMTYARLEELGGIQWPCWDEQHPGDQFLHGRLWDEVVAEPAPFMPVRHSPPVDVLDGDFPLRLTTGRRLESFNTGVQTGQYGSPLHTGGEALRVSPADGARYGLVDGGRALVTSRRGAVEAPVAFDTTLRPGLAFMSLHFPELVDTNILTIDATDPQSGTAEFKATAIRVEPVLA
jgi:formate dehydrogenase major subunit